MTTPEQLAKWREDALNLWTKEGLAHCGELTRFEYFTEGYLRAKQETEQAIKDERKQAWEELLKIAEDHRLDDGGSEYHRGWRNASIRFAKLIEGFLK